MINKTLDHFLRHLDFDETFRTALRELAMGEGEALHLLAEDVAKFGRKHGYEFTADEVHARKEELEGKDLHEGAGGATVVSRKDESGAAKQ